MKNRNKLIVLALDIIIYALVWYFLGKMWFFILLGLNILANVVRVALVLWLAKEAAQAHRRAKARSPFIKSDAINI